MALLYVVVMLCVAGILLSLPSSECVGGLYSADSAATRVFGRIEWNMIGVIGYTLLAISTKWPSAMYVLTWIMTAVTIHLIFKERRLKTGCPLCPVIWALNALIGICVGTHAWIN